MQIRFFYESDGKCFAKMMGGCSVYGGCQKNCETYRCRSYKPEGCKDWVRLDTRNMVRLIPPEEVEYADKQ